MKIYFQGVCVCVRMAVKYSVRFRIFFLWRGAFFIYSVFPFPHLTIEWERKHHRCHGYGANEYVCIPAFPRAHTGRWGNWVLLPSCGKHSYRWCTVASWGSVFSLSLSFPSFFLALVPSFSTVPIAILSHTSRLLNHWNARLDAANGKVQHESLIVSPGPVECCYGTDSSFKPFNNNNRNETSAPGSSRSRSQVGILIKKKLFNQRPLAMGSMVNREPVGCWMPHVAMLLVGCNPARRFVLWK